MTAPIGNPAPTSAPPLEPWRAANLSLVFPGLGQWDAGQRGVGLLLGGITALGWVASVAFTFLSGLPGWVGMLGLFAVAALHVFAVVDAHRRARAMNSPEQELVRTSSRDAWKTLFLNRLVPGVGHAYEGRWPPAVLWFLALLVGLMLPEPIDAPAVGLVTGLAIWNGWSRRRARRVEDRTLFFAVAAAATVWAAAGSAVPPWLRQNLVRAFRIPSASMQPTLVPGDYVLVDMRPFVPRHDDLVVYPSPQHPEQHFVKRVLGLPGDVVEFKPDGAYRNGSRVMEGPVSHDPASIADMLGGEGHPYQVPGGHVFLVGDDLPNSNDSRYQGPTATPELMGRAYKTYWPPGRGRSFR